MCIICIKNKGIEKPSKEMFENMFRANPDGSGFMYNYKNKVYIHKGFMKLEDFERALAKVEKKLDVRNTTFVYHFRITTHGGTSKMNTHPFPLSSKNVNLKALYHTCNIGVVHNGIIDIKCDNNLSDTQTYIKQELSPLLHTIGTKHIFESEHLQQLIYNRIKSKLAFLNANGDVATIGSFITDNGLMFSNDRYEKPNRWDIYGMTDDYIIEVHEVAKGYQFREEYLNQIAEEDVLYIDDCGIIYCYYKGELEYVGETESTDVITVGSKFLASLVY